MPDESTGENPLKPLADYVSRRRFELGINLAELERRGGMGKSWASHLERGTLRGRPKVETLKGLAFALGGVSVPDLMRLAGYPEEAGPHVEAPPLTVGVTLIGGHPAAMFDREAFMGLSTPLRMAILKMLAQLLADALDASHS